MPHLSSECPTVVRRAGRCSCDLRPPYEHNAHSAQSIAGEGVDEVEEFERTEVLVERAVRVTHVEG